MKGKITDSLKPSLTKRPIKVGYWKLYETPGSNECLRQTHLFLNLWGKTIWGNYGKQAKSKWERRVSSRWNHLHKRGVTINGWELQTWTLKPKFWPYQIWILINNFVTITACAKYSELITLKENIISVQQLPLCLPLLFCILFEVLNSGMKGCFDGSVFQDAVCEECFSIPLRCLHL